MTLEDYGFCKKGEAGAFVADGAIEIGGQLPINTSGGLLSETGMPGMQLVHGRRAPDARHGAAAGAGRQAVPREQPGRHDAHARDAVVGELAHGHAQARARLTLTRPYWDALREGHLVFQRCACGHAWLPPRRHCPACLQPEQAGSERSGQGGW